MRRTHVLLAATSALALALCPRAHAYSCVYEEGLDLAKAVALKCFGTDVIQGGGYFNFEEFTKSRVKQKQTLCKDSCLESLGNFRKFVDDCSSKQCTSNPFPIAKSNEACSYGELFPLVEKTLKKANLAWADVLKKKLETKQVSGGDYGWACSSPPKNLKETQECHAYVPTIDTYDKSPAYCNGCGMKGYDSIGPVCNSFCFTDRYEFNSLEDGHYHSIMGPIYDHPYDVHYRACLTECSDSFAGTYGNVDHALRKEFMCKPEMSAEIGKLASIVDKCLAEVCGEAEYKKVFSGPTVGSPTSGPISSPTGIFGLSTSDAAVRGGAVVGTVAAVVGAAAMLV